MGRSPSNLANPTPRIALVWHRAEDETKSRRARLDGVFRALTTLGAIPDTVVWADESAEATRRHLLTYDGVLVWVNPITEGRDRRVLDAVLREVATAGVWVSAHPDVIDTLGTKEILHRTRALGWGGDVCLHRDLGSAKAALPSRLASGPVVLKRLRGHDGLGVWKLALVAGDTEPSLRSIVSVEHAFDGATHDAPLGTFLDDLADYFGSGGSLVEQPFLPRVAEGMVRCYLSGAVVAGFAEHLPRGFVSRADETRTTSGIGFQKIMHGPATPAFEGLRIALETDWIPSMVRTLGMDGHALPAIWDADFLRGEKNADGQEPWVLCEINASCVSPFPDEAAEAIARTAYERVTRLVH
jgi:hypothetical protein